MNTLVLSKHLLWKDYRQLRPALIGCWAILAVILLLNCVRQLLAQDREMSFPDAIMLVLAAPTLAAMAASGILIGHERQTRTWNWSSSLPISWTSSLISKFIIWLVGSGLMVSTLYLLFLLLLQLCRMQGMTRGLSPDWLSPQMVVTTVFFVPLIVYICFSLAALLWNDTLTAFVGAAIVVSVLFVITSDVLPRFLLHTGTLGPADMLVQLLGIVLGFVVLVFVAGIFMVRAYRWRWTTGQLASVGWARRVAAPVSSFQRRLLWQNAVWSGAAPSEFRMLLTHSLSMSLWMRLMILAGTLALAIYAGGGPDAALGVTIFGAAIMGVTVFAGDQSQAAYKFLADRGVNWWQLLLARALPAFVLAITPVVCVVLLTARSLEPSTALALIVSGMGAFLLGLFCSLSTRLPLLSLTLAVGAVIAALLAWTSVLSFYYSLNSRIPPTAVVLMFLAEASVLITATTLLLRRWLVYDRVQGIYYYLAALFIGLVPTHLLAVGLCFLTIPNVPWQGLPADQVKTVSTRPRATLEGTLPMTMQSRLYSYDTSRSYEAINFTLEQMRVDANFYPKDKRPTNLGAGEGSLEIISAELEAMEAALDRLPSEATLDPNSYPVAGQVENSAWLALWATQNLKDLELARRAWKVNRQLLSRLDYGTMECAQALPSRLLSALLRKHLTGEDWAFLQSGGSLAELQPDPVSSVTWSTLSRMQATVDRDGMKSHLRNYPQLKIFFPLIWYHERKHAWIVQQELLEIEGKRAEWSFTSFSAIVPHSRYIPMIMGLESRLPK